VSPHLTHDPPPVSAQLSPAGAETRVAAKVSPSQTEIWKAWSARPRWWPPWLVAGWCAALFFVGLNAGDLYRTESLRAIIGQEMLSSGDWIVPRLYGEPLFTKPPVMYMLIALCGWPIGGVTDWSARIPSAVAAALTVFLFYRYFQRRLGQMAALVAALILPMAPIWLDKATSAEIDMVQVAWVTASLLFFFRAVEISEQRQLAFKPRGESSSPAGDACKELVAQTFLSAGHPRGSQSLTPRLEPAVPPPTAAAEWFWWLAAMVCMTGGFLTKWTAPAFFYGTALTLLWRRGQLRLMWSRYHLVGLAVAAGIVLSWIAAVFATEDGGRLLATVQREGLSRLIPYYAGHSHSWWPMLWHPFAIFLNTLPWSIVALWTLRPGFAASLEMPGRRVWQEMHCWLWPSLVIFSLLTEHAPRHSFPMFPAVAGLAALVWTGWLTGRLPWSLPRLPPARVLAASMVLWLAAKLIVVTIIMPQRSNEREAAAKGSLLASLVPLDKILYLFYVKDEGIMFYYGRPVVRLPSPQHLPASSEPIYCILTKSECQQWSSVRPMQVLRQFTDEQGDPVVLVRVLPSPHASLRACGI
jgi:4-amino-4-deoxy-L-arabinose transferase-like glycosyltransferase